MKKYYHPKLFLDAACILLLTLVPLRVSAQSALVTTTASTLPSILITELQTGSSSSGKDEFVELYNTTDTALDLSNWQLRYFSASSTTATLDKPGSTITITPAIGDDAVLVPPHGYFVLHTATESLPTNVASQLYGYTLPAAGGSVVLMQPNSSTCALSIENAFAWGTGVWGQGLPFTPTSSKDQIMTRVADAAGNYVDTNNNSTNFIGFAATTVPNPATPGADNLQPAPTIPPVGGSLTVGQAVAGTQITDTACTPSTTPPANTNTGDGSGVLPPTDGDTPPVTIVDGDGDDTSGTSSSTTTSATIPVDDVGLTAPQITELLPNPIAPQTDAADEFIELYNSNAAPFDLSGLQLEVGLTTKHYFTFATNTMLPAQSFVAFYSANTGLSMSNSGGQAWLLDPSGTVLSQTDAYGTAADGQAWALANGKWYWTTSPTPNAANVVVLPVSKSSSTTKAAVAKTASAKTTSTKAKAATTAKATKAKKATTSTTAAQDDADVVNVNPVHPVVLAVAAGFALLYGGYEYRRDLANKYHQFQRYRTARRTSRQESAGR